MAADYELLERLIVALNVTVDGKPTSARKFADDAIEHFVGFLMVAACAQGKPANVSDAMLRVLGQIASDAGASPDDPPPAMLARLLAHYADHPPHPEMLAIYKRISGEVAARGGDAQIGAAFAGFLDKRAPTGVLGGGVRPAGTVPGGPLARLAAMKPPTKK